MNAFVRRTWAARTCGEYRSSAVSAEMLHWLVQLAVSPDTLIVAHGVVGDELTHAEASLGVFLAAGGTQADIRLDRRVLSLRGVDAEPLARRALYFALEEFALHETFALAVFLAMRPAAAEPVVAQAIERIIRDEARHRMYGWELVDELLDATGDVAWLASHADAAVARVTSTYAGAPEPSAAERRWGLLGPVDYDTAIADCLTEIVRPRLVERGLVISR